MAPRCPWRQVVPNYI